MYHVAETTVLVDDGVITAEQAREIELRARGAMIALAINTLLCAGILAATLGLVVLLANAVAVAVFGSLALAVGIWILRSGTVLYRMFGNAAALIGSGMLMSGATIELLDKYSGIAPVLLGVGGAIAAIAGANTLLRGRKELRFALGAITLMGVVMHLVGLYVGLSFNGVNGLPVSLMHIYAAALIFAAGVLTNVRLVSALAILPFAQMLDTGTNYFSAMYVFYSPETTLSIVQMSVLIALCLWVASKVGPRIARHTGMLAVMAFIILNMCFLVGSIWGDVVGETFWGPSRHADGLDWEQFRDARAAFRATALTIHEHVYSIAWALFLIGIVAWAAMGNRRGLFNVGMTFAGIHAYTQMFETFGDEPLAYVIGGLAALPAAWGLWRLNERFKTPT